MFSDVVLPAEGGIDLAPCIRPVHHDLPMLPASGHSHVRAGNGTSGFALPHEPDPVE